MGPFVWREDAKALRTLSSMSAFECTEISIFRGNLKKRLRATILRYSKSVKFTEVGAVHELQQLLDEAFPWRELCNARNSLELSFLDEICETLVSPIIIPPAYSISTFLSLLHAVVYHSERARKETLELCREADLRLLECMMIICKRLSSFSFTVALNFFLQEILINITGKDFKIAKKRKLEAGRVDMFISVFSQLAIRMNSLWWNCSCMKLFMEIIRSLDNFDLLLLDHDSKSQDSCEENICLTCEKPIVPLFHTPLPRNHGVSMLEMLEGEEIEGIARYCKTKVKDAKEQCHCIYNERQSLSQASNFTKLPFFLIVLRRRAYSACLELLRLCPPLNNEQCYLSNMRSKWTVPKNIIQFMLNDIFLIPDSPSLRLCLLLLAESSSAMNFVLDHLWKEVDRNSSYVEIALRIWSEIIVESTLFDEPNVCWRAMEPLLTRILGYCEENYKHDATNNIMRKHKNSKLHLFLRSLAYVLSRRRPSLYIESIQPVFENFVARSSVAFGECRYWNIEYDNPVLLETLVNVGLVGWDMTGTSLEDEHPILSSSVWPFTKDRGLRGSFHRMGPQVNLSLSYPQNVNSLSRKLQKEKNIVLIPPSLTADTFILDYLYDDLLRHCFSYLNYVDLIKVSRAHPVFETLSKENSNWKKIYSANFGPVLGDQKDFQQALKRAGGSWKNIFMENYRQEKKLKFQYTVTGGDIYKHRICGYLGCHQVLRNKARQIKHYQVHERRIHERRSQREKAETLRIKTKKRISNELTRVQYRKKMKEENIEGATKTKEARKKTARKF